ncbi:hypothetical protein HGRIS_013680 [Hohenbuehelia grisea]|uniref:Carboxylic ester hydrolase n=1 Tax=Hohenbuehelia grisea TaxID=104357 RepID=A0ABR3IWK4_9AGAR
MRLSWSIILVLPSVIAAPQVKLGKTTLIGRDITPFRQEFFGGIPFTEPPVGRLRLKPPVLKTSLSVPTFDASSFGLACMQTGVSAEKMSEDCLTINVLRPAGTPANASLPVMAWVYGGSFTHGDASIYNASAIVAQSAIRGTPIVYVNFNYRLGPLGFPQGREADNRGALNLALKDQLAALEWIQCNIGLFGGDKSKVTVFGESAGAISLAILFLNSPIQRLARAAIFESGSAATSMNFDAERREGNWQAFVAAVPQCASFAGTTNSFACLQSVTNSSVLLQAAQTAAVVSGEEFPWDPTIDGPGGLMPDIPSRLFAKGKFARLPFISGTNLDEGTVFSPSNVNSTEQVRQAIIASFTPSPLGPESLSNAADRLLELYPDVPALGSPFGTGNETFGLSSQFKRIAALQGDLGFHSQRRFWTQTAANAGVKTFGYHFTDPQTGSPQDGVSHGSEVFYVYGALALTGGTPSAIKLSSVMIDYWVSFATSLDPNDGKGNPRPNWEQYTPKNKAVIQLNGANTTMIPDTYREEQISFINSIPLVFHHRRSL